MIFVLYKIINNHVIFTGAYESKKDAEDKKRLLSCNDFNIVEIPFWTNKEYNKKEPVMKYSEEDNNMDED